MKRKEGNMLRRLGRFSYPAAELRNPYANLPAFCRALSPLRNHYSVQSVRRRIWNLKFCTNLVL